MKLLACINLLSAITVNVLCQTSVTGQQKKLSPHVLPGKGLQQYDFFYARETKTQNMYIVQKGQITWGIKTPLQKAK